MIAKIAKTLLITATATLTLTGCLANQTARHETARRTAGSAFMKGRDLQTKDFSLRLFERVHKRGGFAQIYIEGDDIETGIDATPQTPISLQLAARDKAKNVIYIARPCQYNGRTHTFKETAGEVNGCPLKYTTTHRFAPEVIEGYQTTLDEIKRRWGIKGFHIYGHSGGGAIAAILATKRTDILSLTTIAGNLDTESYSAHLLRIHYSQHKGLDGSLNPKDIAPLLKTMPQHHYLGAADIAIPPAVLHNYLGALGATNCAQYSFIQENGYTEGWTDKWPAFLKDKPACKGPIKKILMD